jgi:hypothetical protein
MSKLNMVAAAVLVMLAGPAWALDDTPENRSKEANRYMAATPPKEMFQDAAEQMAKNLPAEQQSEFKNLMTKHLDIPALEKAMKEGMIKHFTADELKALADFYGSPVGKSAMKKFGVYMAEVMPSIQAEIMKAQAKANRELSEDTEKK